MPTQTDQSLLTAFEACGKEAFGGQAGWGQALSSSLMNDLAKYRDYRCARHSERCLHMTDLFDALVADDMYEV